MRWPSLPPPTEPRVTRAAPLARAPGRMHSRACAPPRAAGGRRRAVICGPCAADTRLALAITRALHVVTSSCARPALPRRDSLRWPCCQ
eukprot:834801-Prymnesium_polylepis.1